MPEIQVGAQIFDVVFHPTSSTVYTGLLTGHIKAFAYDDQGNSQNTFSIRPSKRSCRGLSLNDDGTKLFAVGKAKALNIIDTTTSSLDTRAAAHDAPINRVKSLMPWTVATGDDDGTVKLWDTRQRESVRTYTQHFDYISDFLWLGDKKQLVVTSGDGTLSVIDVRSKKLEPIAQSEDQEDELLSIVAIKGSAKVLVGTQLGIISVFNRGKGWADCVDRVPGHPLSVEALCNIPASIPGVDATSTVLTGSSDGFVRAVQILPTKLLGVVADHGEFPVERIAVGGGVGQLAISKVEGSGDTRTGEGSATRVGGGRDVDQESVMEEEVSRQRRWWVGSVGHEDVLRMTDLEGFFRENSENVEMKGAFSEVDDDESGEEDGLVVEGAADGDAMDVSDEDDSSASEMSEEGDESDAPQPKKRKRTLENDGFDVAKTKKGRNEVESEKTFFDDL